MEISADSQHKQIAHVTHLFMIVLCYQTHTKFKPLTILHKQDTLQFLTDLSWGEILASKTLLGKNIKLSSKIAEPKEHVSCTQGQGFCYTEVWSAVQVQVQ